MECLKVERKSCKNMPWVMSYKNLFITSWTLTRRNQKWWNFHTSCLIPGKDVTVWGGGWHGQNDGGGEGGGVGILLGCCSSMSQGVSKMVAFEVRVELLTWSGWIDIADTTMNFQKSLKYFFRYIILMYSQEPFFLSTHSEIYQWANSHSKHFILMSLKILLVVYFY